MANIASLTRHVVGNRRRHSRKRHVYQTLLLNELQEVLFRGNTIDISRTGARLQGLPVGVGPKLGQRVRVEFLVIPRDPAQVSRRMAVYARIWRIEELTDRYAVVVRFSRTLNT
jgi:hypothetical protein